MLFVNLSPRKRRFSTDDGVKPNFVKMMRILYDANEANDVAAVVLVSVLNGEGSYQSFKFFISIWLFSF